jgi:hypothetical protein
MEYNRERKVMPELSRFLGIVIRMFASDHNPPHFHAIYNEYEAQFSISPLEVIKGKLPPRIQSLVIEWAAINQKELLNNWRNLQAKKETNKIKPLV